MAPGKWAAPVLKKYSIATALKGYTSKTGKHTRRYAMSLAENAIISDTNEVWDYLVATEEERVTFETSMEGWINGLSAMLEYECNRHIAARTYQGATQDGNGRRWLYLDHYPILSIDALSIQDNTGIVITTVDVTTDLFIKHQTGRITLTPSLGTFLRGDQNIVVTYKGGFEGPALEPFKNAVKEMISIPWQEKGSNPLIFVRSDNIGTSVSSTKFDPRRLSHIVQRVVWMTRNVEV
jgi:hypothetical protein